MSFLDEGTFVGKGAVKDAVKDPEFKALKSDEKANALKTLKMGGSVTTEDEEDNLDEDLADFIRKAGGSQYKTPFTDFANKLKKTLSKDDDDKDGTSKKEDNLLIKKIADIEKGNMSDEEFKSIAKKLNKAGMSRNELKELTKRFKAAQKEKDTVKEGKLSRFLGGLALSAAALGAIGNINQSDKVLQDLKAKYEQADTKEEKKKINDQISKRILFLDTGKSDSSTPMNEETITGEYEGKPVKFKIKDITNLKDILDVSKSAKDFVNKISMAVTDETSSLSREDAKKLILFYKKRTMKEAEDIKLPSDTTFTLDLKHLVKKHMNKGNDKESAIKFTKALMKKLHNKGEVNVDGTKVIFKEMKMDQDIPLALPEPDAPDFLGDDGMDYEGGMAKSQMLKMKKYVDALSNMIEDESQLESWVQAKLTKASDYMSAVYHYLDYQKSKMNELNEDEGQNIADFLNANYKEIASKLGNPGSNFEIIGDDKVATAGDGNEGIDISFDKNHMDKLFPKDDPYNEVKELTIAGKVVYYNDYRGN